MSWRTEMETRIRNLDKIVTNLCDTVRGLPLLADKVDGGMWMTNYKDSLEYKVIQLQGAIEELIFKQCPKCSGTGKLERKPCGN